MIYAVFLCDRKWNIRKIRQCSPDLSLSEGESLFKMISEKEKLEDNEEE